MFQRCFQIKYLAFVAVISVLPVYWGCGTGENIVTPEFITTPGAYSSLEAATSIIQAHAYTNSDEAQPSGIPIALKSGEWETSEIVNVKEREETIILDVPGVRQVKFKVKENALEKVTEISIKLVLEVISNADGIDELVTLYFEFGPSGTQFDPYAELMIPFELLLTDEVDTFVITDEKGNEIEGVSYDIDYDQRKLITYIPHFSSYYYSRR
ncbi:hypothetical protein H8E77_39975 [bacterium]|nr:hypothetical protein [bacterium]